MMCSSYFLEKPYIQATLENTANENAVAAREFLEREYRRI